MRFGLHVLTGRHEDRLLFDHQIRLAQTFGYEDASYTLAVEQLMQRYYRTVLDVSCSTSCCCRCSATRSSPRPRRRVRSTRASRSATNTSRPTTNMFARTPSSLLELFVLLQQNPQVQGVSASTMRADRRNLWLIDEEFRQNPRNHRLFLEILRAPAGVTHELRRMNTYGVLGRYIPAFGRIVGRMQYDLFHAYTVDAHTLFVVSNLRRLALPKYDHELPKLSAIMQQLRSRKSSTWRRCSTTSPRAAAAITRNWARWTRKRSVWNRDCRATTRAWWPGWCGTTCELSITAQKKDIGDPEVINEFARRWATRRTWTICTC